MKKIKAGASKVDITPPLGTIINGDFISHYAREIYDTMYAKALVLQDAGITLAICVVDICAMKRSLLDEVKKQVQQQTGILPDNILISSTHTHAAGSVESLLLGAADLPYRQKIPALIVQSIVEAHRNLADAKIGFGSFNAPEFVLCRRYAMKEGYAARNPVSGGLDKVKTNPFGAEEHITGPVSEIDPELCYVAVKSTKEEWLSILANFSLHYVGDWQNGTISPDYFGEFSNQLKIELNASDDFVAMMSNGTSGEANIWDFLDPARFPSANFEKSRLIGGNLAKRLAGSAEEIIWQHTSSLFVSYQELNVDIRKPAPQALTAARIIVAETNYEDVEGIDFETMQKLYAREQVLLNEFPGTINFPVQAFKIGDIVIGALGGEFFAETGLALKKYLTGNKYFTITLANDYVGYVCPQHEIERGGYETWLCRTSCLEVTAEHQIRTILLELIRNMK